MLYIICYTYMSNCTIIYLPMIIGQYISSVLCIFNHLMNNFVHKTFPVVEIISLMLILKSEILGSKSKMFYKTDIPLITFEGFFFLVYKDAYI